MSTTILCADCGTECALVDGRTVDPRDPEIADVQVWACPDCSCSWAHRAEAAGASVGLPASLKTRNARELLAERKIYPLLEQETGGVATLQPLAIDRLTNFLAHRMGIEPEECEVARFSLDQCREAWAALSGVTFADVRHWAATHRGVKRPGAGQGIGHHAHAHAAGIQAVLDLCRGAPAPSPTHPLSQGGER